MNSPTRKIQRVKILPEKDIFILHLEVIGLLLGGGFWVNGIFVNIIGGNRDKNKS